MKITEDDIIKTFNNLLGFEGNETRGSVGEFVVWSCDFVYAILHRGVGENIIWYIAIGENSLSSREFSGGLNELEEKVRKFIFLDRMRKL